MKIAIFLIGIPASGKTTERKRMEAPYVSMDEIREELTGSISDQSRNKEVAETAFERWDELLGDENSVLVILDNTNYNKKNRKKFLEIAKKHKAMCEAIVFPLSFKDAVERNSKRDRVVPFFVLERMFNGFEYPTSEEGFDIILNF